MTQNGINNIYLNQHNKFGLTEKDYKHSLSTTYAAEFLWLPETPWHSWHFATQSSKSCHKCRCFSSQQESHFIVPKLTSCSIFWDRLFASLSIWVLNQHWSKYHTDTPKLKHCPAVRLSDDLSSLLTQLFIWSGTTGAHSGCISIMLKIIALKMVLAVNSDVFVMKCCIVIIQYETEIKVDVVAMFSESGNNSE